MPSAINVNGVVTRRPGVYGRADASSLAGSVLDVNQVALIGEFPLIEQGVPTRFNTPQQFKDLDTAGVDNLATFAKFLWTPANDPKVPGGPNAVYLTNIQPNTQAQYTLEDASFASSLTLKAKMWGPRGNKTRFAMVANGDDATLRDLVIEREGLSETYTALGSGPLVSFYYDGTEMDTVTAAFASDTLTIVQTKATIPLGTYNPSEAVFDGVLALGASVGPAGGEEYTADVTGINKVTGLADTEQWLWTNAGGTVPTLPLAPKQWSSISSIVFATDGASVPTFNLQNDAFSLDAATYPLASQLGDRVNVFNAQEYYAIIASPRAYSTPTTELDDLVAAGIDAGIADAESVRADLYFIVQALNASILVEAEAASGATAIPAPIPDTFLIGGGVTTTVSADRVAALDALVLEDVQIIVTNSSNAGFHDEILAHCQTVVAKGGGERNAWLPAATTETKAQIQTRTAALNSRHVAMVAQDVRVRDTDGLVKWYDPWLLAVIMAGIQSSTQVGTPMTRKIPNVIDVRQNTAWNPNLDAEELLQIGLCFLTRWRLGWRVERSITTYQIDDNPIFSEVSANESMDTSIRDLRENLDSFIGDPAAVTSRARIESLSKVRLRQQVELGIIKAFNEPALNVEDLGDRFRVNYELAATEPINFIEVSATVTRTPFGQ